ncbi:putative LRR receptor-like serine/threonine-protein kinase [Apostasia shenzhenica]|uniref:non-specific serine/threonine protein kinase n=1 Tax=Apostasia shenzhenica TaxID=1088818 RepID=A0A2I0BC50_9ASPA|nr:putative LRR receptor-like serine/threonine-protein kinase [Apostasia shenzhenica]
MEKDGGHLVFLLLVLLTLAFAPVTTESVRKWAVMKSSFSHVVVSFMPSVEALKSIGKAINKTDWDFSVDPCSQQSGWVSPDGLNGFKNSVLCSNCSDDGSVCHVTSIILKNQNLVGMLPPEMAKLPFLQELDLTRNYLYGTIPNEWEVLPLVNFSVLGNQLSGQIPSWIGNITTLINLDLQATGLDGPIPTGVSHLKNLDDLRISDINGNSGFPQLKGIEQLRYLTLRNCGIAGEIPQFLEGFINLKRLINFIVSVYRMTESYDLFGGLSLKTVLHLRAASLCPGLRAARQSSASVGDAGVLRSERVLCLDTIPCSGGHWSLYINCGGDEVTDDEGHKFESDNDGTNGVSTFRLGTNWALSSTGSFLDTGDNNNFIVTTSKGLSMPDSALYANARVSPQSLSYVGLCLLNGNYSVKLHFAEIVMTDENGHRSPGRRIFDVYIQGELVLRDFNIKAEANGSGKAIVQKFNTVVTQNKLEIRFYWAGKGTTHIPTTGTYGPLISAISVDPNFKPPGKSRRSVILSLAIAVPVLCLIILALFAFWKKGYLTRKDSIYQNLRRLDLQTGSFTLRQIQAATSNFHASNKIGEGGFGSVYKGLLSDGTIIAVKQLSSKSTQGNREFLNEIGMISALQHPNLVKLYGCCVEGNQLLLVYEYMENNSLAHALFGPEKGQVKLDWSTRFKICIGIARGLAYLHEESMLRIVHRDIKATNVLLDKDLNPKISDFGLAKLNEKENTHISTRIAGTMGYMAPEYVTRGYLTVKADVYSFGILALEIVCGRSITKRTNDGHVHLLDWAHILWQKGELQMLVDKRLGSDFNKVEALLMAKVALFCSNPSPVGRPAMSAVVRLLTSNNPDLIRDSNIKHDFIGDEMLWNSLDNKSSVSDSLTLPLHSGEGIDESGTSNSDFYHDQKDSV